VDEQRHPGCVLLPSRVGVSGWEVGYRLGLCGLVLANWAMKVGCVGKGEKERRSGPESRQLAVLKGKEENKGMGHNEFGPEDI
jgi:hypothetical protein